MTSQEIRRQFIDFFVRKHGHTFVPSSPVVPHDDPTLLFTNAGMNQFKPYFLGVAKPPYPRVANTQKCIRAGGKHNDLDDVGRSRRHHTFFEMLGNWSFGDYFKRGAIEMAWELLTKVWGLDPTRLHVSCYEGDPAHGVPRDDEVANIWKEVAGLPDDHIHYFGKDNFWEMGETGPCGPCTEIYVDRTPDKTGGPQVNGTDPRVMEIWNLVFIQYNRDAAGKLTTLPSQHVDTGMGLERICQVLQGKEDNYATDLFTPIFDAISQISNLKYTGLFPATNKPDPQAEAANPELRKDIAFRVIADHLRMATFAVTDGAVPDNKERGSTLRSVIRRAVRFGWQELKLRDPFLFKLVPVIVDTMGDMFPELRKNPKHVMDVIKDEELSFSKTLDRGLSIFADEEGTSWGEYAHNLQASFQTLLDAHSSAATILTNQKEGGQLQELLETGRQHEDQIQRGLTQVRDQQEQMRQQDEQLRQFLEPIRRQDEQLRQFLEPIRRQEEQMRQILEPIRRQEEQMRQILEPIRRQEEEMRRMLEPIRRQEEEMRRMLEPIRRQEEEMRQMLEPIRRQEEEMRQMLEPIRRQEEEMRRMLEPIRRQEEEMRQMLEPIRRQEEERVLKVMESVRREEEDKLTALASIYEQLLRQRAAIRLFEEALNKGALIPAEVAFKLHDTYGFPIDLTRIMAEERGMKVDVAGYEVLMEKAKDLARSGGKAEASAVYDLPPNVLAELEKMHIHATDDQDKYAHKQITATVRALWNGRNLEQSTSASDERAGQQVALILDKTNFYAEMGGQVGDSGEIRTTNHGVFIVETARAVAGYVLHIGHIAHGTVEAGDSVEADVLGGRERIQQNHTATHLANWALREVLGDHVQQKGSLVDDEKLRFDFVHQKSLAEDELGKVETLVCERIERQWPVYTQVAPQEDALKIFGLRAIFGEKYPPMVRVVSIGAKVSDLLADPANPQWRQYSVEFCGGTHLANTSETGGFVITAEEAVSKGIRRIVALTGQSAKDAATQSQVIAALLEQAKQTPEENLPGLIAALQKAIAGAGVSLRIKRKTQTAIADLQAKHKQWQKAQAAGAQGSGAGEAAGGDALLAKAQTVNGTALIVASVPEASADSLRNTMDWLKKKHPQGNIALLLASAFTDKDKDGNALPPKVNLLAAVGDPLIGKLKAGDWIKTVAPLVGGTGGGRPQLAMAGGKDASKIDEALAAAREYAVRKLA